MASEYKTPALLALEDGTVFRGRAFGARGSRSGEVVFNTALTGYQEVLTDPSYCGQIITMTMPQIGNYGVNREDDESPAPHAAGFVVRELSRCFSNYRAVESLPEFMSRQGVIGIEGIDTRAVTRRVRVHGAMRGLITTERDDPAACVEVARSAARMEGADLVSVVAPKEPYEWSEPTAAESADDRTVVAVDCGMKRNILRQLGKRFGRVQVVPAGTSAGLILDYRPDGVFVSNGPGDPAAVGSTVQALRELCGRVPVFGICLGHQLLALSMGASSYKLKFGHHGANHPVRQLATGRVEITSQNHGFAIDRDSLVRAGATITHVNLNDQTVEGFCHSHRAVLAIQYHPEAAPGPHDATYLFDCFARMIETGRAPSAEDLADAQTGDRVAKV